MKVACVRASVHNYTELLQDLSVVHSKLWVALCEGTVHNYTELLQDLSIVHKKL
jgi:hypothetical protein